MPIHIGSLIQQEVERKRLTYKEFGALIHRNEKTVPDIYDRESMSTDLLLTISGALKVDLLSVYYTEEPLKSLRNDEVGSLRTYFSTIWQYRISQVRYWKKRIIILLDFRLQGLVQRR